MSWAKGLTKETDPRIRRIAESKIGKHYNVGRKHSEETKRKLSEIRKNYVPTEETKEKIREAYRNMPEEKKELRKQHCSEAQMNLCWVTNEEITLRINKSELEHYLSIGYKQGRMKLNKKES